MAELSHPPTDLALPAASAVVQAAAGMEETRFNNLNSRAVALVSASSLVTALIGVFSKELLGETLRPVRNWVAGSLVVAVVALVLSVSILIVGVLLPARRFTFGDNKITNPAAPLASAAEVQKEIWSEYTQVLADLQKRNGAKAQALHLAYLLYGLAVLAAAVAVVRVALLAL